MLDASNVNSGLQRNQPLSNALALEREYLFQLGTSLGRCAEKLVCLALQDARRMSARSPTRPMRESARDWAYFIGALTPALVHTEIDTKVRYDTILLQKAI